MQLVVNLCVRLMQFCVAPRISRSVTSQNRFAAHLVAHPAAPVARSPSCATRTSSDSVHLQPLPLFFFHRCLFCPLLAGLVVQLACLFLFSVVHLRPSRLRVMYVPSVCTTHNSATVYIYMNTSMCTCIGGLYIYIHIYLHKDRKAERHLLVLLQPRELVRNAWGYHLQKPILHCTTSLLCFVSRWLNT